MNRQVARSWCIPMFLALLAGGMGCGRGHFTVVADREAKLYAYDTDGAGYVQHSVLRPDKPVVLEPSAHSYAAMVLLVSGDEVAAIRRNPNDGREIRVGAGDWVEVGPADLAILSRDLSPGMTQEHVEQHWGRPQRREVTEGPKVVRETWVYISTTHRQFLFFEGGVLETWSSALEPRRH